MPSGGLRRRRRRARRLWRRRGRGRGSGCCGWTRPGLRRRNSLWMCSSAPAVPAGSGCWRIRHSSPCRAGLLLPSPMRAFSSERAAGAVDSTLRLAPGPRPPQDSGIEWRQAARNAWQPLMRRRPGLACTLAGLCGPAPSARPGPLCRLRSSPPFDHAPLLMKGRLFLLCAAWGQAAIRPHPGRCIRCIEVDGKLQEGRGVGAGAAL